MNLSQIANDAIITINPNEEIYIIQAVSQENIKGILKPIFAFSKKIEAQIQSLNSDDLQQFDNNLRTEVLRKFYLNCDLSILKHKPQGQDRNNQQGGDFIYRIKDKTFWKICGLPDDYSATGWVCVNGALQVEVPNEVKNAIIEEIE